MRQAEGSRSRRLGQPPWRVRWRGGPPWRDVSPGRRLASGRPDLAGRPGFGRSAAGCGPDDAGELPAGPPWKRGGKHASWPPGAAVGASIFHLAGTHDLAEQGRVYLEAGPLYYLLLLAGPIALLWRRRAPLPSFVVAAGASLAFATRAEPYWMYAVAPAIALFALAKQGRRTAAAIAAALAWAGYLLVTVVLAGPLNLPAGVSPGLREATLAAAGLGGAVLCGMVSKVHSEQVATIARARRERARAEEEQERRQASEERLRIARELHDALGHHLSLINVQAGVGLHLMDSRPEQAREALSAIKTASAEALREVRSVLGVLRTEGEEAPRQPALGLSRLSDLTAGAGFPVRTRVDGAERELPAEVDRAAYRIVQEALTNVRRHAGPEATALVEIRYVPGALMLSITNTGRSAAPEDPDAEGGSRGSGITGMQARALSLGGTFSARPSPGGGFLVDAVLPTDPATRDASPWGAPPPHRAGPPWGSSGAPSADDGIEGGELPPGPEVES